MNLGGSCYSSWPGTVALGANMQDMKVHLEKLLRDAAECKLISDLATDVAKRDLFAPLAEHLSTLAGEVDHAIRRTIAGDGASRNLSHARRLNAFKDL